MCMFFKVRQGVEKRKDAAVGWQHIVLLFSRRYYIFYYDKVIKLLYGENMLYDILYEHYFEKHEARRQTDSWNYARSTTEEQREAHWSPLQILAFATPFGHDGCIFYLHLAFHE